MLPALLITFREVIEATLIVATILGILIKLNQIRKIHTVWLGVAAATFASIALLGIGSMAGFKIHEIYTGRTEELFEGTLMIISAVFITWAVFWLHTYFARQKLALLQKVKQTIYTQNQKGLFLLVFTAVFREGLEIVLFLSTIYLSSNPVSIFFGFSIGFILALGLSLLLFTATYKLPLYKTFQLTTLLLILFAAGLATRGVHEFVEAGLLPEYSRITLMFLPYAGHWFADLIKAIFGLTRNMDYLQLIVYGSYIAFMRWYLYGRESKSSNYRIT